jgi:drug/metabolite transporter (DMT)-like permease
MPMDQASWGGMKLLHLILGTMGAGVSLVFLPQFSNIALARTMFAGIFCATIVTPLLVALYARYVGDPLPGVENVLAAILGILGVYLIPGAQALASTFRDDPRGFIARLRGRGGPPRAGGQP